jgi:hypothetical protein
MACDYRSHKIYNRQINYMGQSPSLETNSHSASQEIPHLLFFLLLVLLPLAPQPSLGLGLLHKIRLISWRLLNNFLFYKVGLLAPRPTPSRRTRLLYLYPQEAGWLPILVASYDTYSSPFMEPEISLQFSQDAATGACPKPFYSPIFSHNISFRWVLILFSQLLCGLPNILFIIFGVKFCRNILSFPCVLHALPILSWFHHTSNVC